MLVQNRASFILQEVNSFQPYLENGYITSFAIAIYICIAIYLFVYVAKYLYAASSVRTSTVIRLPLQTQTSSIVTDTIKLKSFCGFSN